MISVGNAFRAIGRSALPLEPEILIEGSNLFLLICSLVLSSEVDVTET